VGYAQAHVPQMPVQPATLLPQRRRVKPLHCAYTACSEADQDCYCGLFKPDAKDKMRCKACKHHESFHAPLEDVETSPCNYTMRKQACPCLVYVKPLAIISVLAEGAEEACAACGHDVAFHYAEVDVEEEGIDAVYGRTGKTFTRGACARLHTAAPRPLGALTLHAAAQRSCRTTWTAT
jgi:hypothetical protein